MSNSKDAGKKAIQQDRVIAGSAQDFMEVRQTRTGIERSDYLEFLLPEAIPTRRPTSARRIPTGGRGK